MKEKAVQIPDSNWRKHLHEVVFESETPSGRAFDVILILIILISVAAVMLESLVWVREIYGVELYLVEWEQLSFLWMDYRILIIYIARV